VGILSQRPVLEGHTDNKLYWRRDDLFREA
jgi:hypothetical protein